MHEGNLVAVALRARGVADRRWPGVDIAPHVALVNSLLQVYRALGLKRRAKEVKLADYLRKGEPIGALPPHYQYEGKP